MSSITPNSGSQINLTEALDLVAKFRSKFPTEIKGSFVGINNLKLILEQPNCIGIRVYNGYDTSNGRHAPVFVGVDAAGKDMTEIIVDRTCPCPTDCDLTSPLIK